MLEASISASSKLLPTVHQWISKRLGISNSKPEEDETKDGGANLFHLLTCSVAAIIAIANIDSARHLWSACGDSLQSLWDRFLLIVGDDDYTLFVYGTTIWLTVLYWSVGAVYTVMDVSGRPQWIRKYKVQPGMNEPVERTKLIGAVKNVLFNQIVVGIPFAMLGFWAMKQVGTPLVHQLPTFQRLLLEVVVFVLLEEIFFYYSHRLLHHRRIYKYIHKMHHEWTSPIAISALYCHPIEHVLSNMVPPVLGPIFMSSHVAVSWLWFGSAILRTLNFHSGYHLPGFPSPQHHDFHHNKFNECFGFFGFLDTLHGTDKVFRSTVPGKRDIISFCLKPVSHLIPDDKTTAKCMKENETAESS